MTNTKKKIFASYKMFRKGIEKIEILILCFNYFKLSIPKTMFADLFVLILDLIALAHTLIALTHLNEKLHRLYYFIVH